jgi:hypothetical protein
MVERFVILGILFMIALTIGIGAGVLFLIEGEGSPATPIPFQTACTSRVEYWNHQHVMVCK